MELQEKLSLLRRVAPPTQGQPKATLLSLQVGSVVALTLPGKNKALFMVEEAYLYHETNKSGERKKYHWREYMLRNLHDFSTCFLEVEDDDGLAAYLTGEKIAQGRLGDVPGKDTKTLNVAGYSPFYLDEFCRAVFEGKQGDEHVMLLDYENDDDILLGVEVWDNENCEAYLYSEISVSNIEVVAHE